MTKLWKILVLALSSSVCIAEQVQQGKIYPGGSYVESSQTGIGLTIPQGWQGAWPAGSEMFVLESTTLKANIFMAMQPADENELRGWMAGTIPLDASIQLQPASLPKKTGKIYTANYTINDAPQLSGYIAAQIVPPSTGLAFIVLSADAGKLQKVKRIAVSLANSLTIKQVVAPAPTQRKGEFYQSGDASAVSDGNCTYFSSGAGSISTCD
ncbi:hypothetical protein MNBD_GAMMA05-751 [hydrothermal vent metagenome]|uniref:Uncharacterized protein n=1 Tax=hydrothermal vent metagenome TaxID=652676 RepID=A0A3B0WTF1_9ZZZZ